MNLNSGFKHPKGFLGLAFFRSLGTSSQTEFSLGGPFGTPLKTNVSLGKNRINIKKNLYKEISKKIID